MILRDQVLSGWFSRLARMGYGETPPDGMDAVTWQRAVSSVIDRLLRDTGTAPHRGSYSLDNDTVATPNVASPEEAQRLLDGVPAGDFEAVHPDDLPGRSVVVGGRETRPPYDYFVVAVEGQHRVALAELFAAAPRLARELRALADENGRLLGLLDDYSVCSDCGEKRGMVPGKGDHYCPCCEVSP